MLDYDIEVRLLRDHAVKWALCLALIIVVHNSAHNAVFMNWSRHEMYRYETLPDLIMSGESLHVSKTANGVRMGTFIMMAVTAIMALFFKSTHSSVLLVRKFIAVYAASSLLRCATFFVTLLPGTAPYCLAPSVGGTYSPRYAPKDWYDVLTIYNWTHACGDLLFSGHTILVVCMWLAIERIFAGYWQRFHTADGTHARFWCVAQAFAVYGARLKLVLFLYNTVKARKHYTIDVMVATYVTTLLWLVIAPYLPTTPEEEEQRQLPPLKVKHLNGYVKKDAQMLREHLHSV